MKKFIILFAILFLLPFSAHAQTAYQTEPISSEAMQRCQSFADCTLIWNGCEDMGINKQYADQFKQRTVCWQTKEHNPQAVPTCTDGMCVVVAPDEKK